MVTISASHAAFTTLLFRNKNQKGFDPSATKLCQTFHERVSEGMPKTIIDEFTSLPISRQRRYQLRKHRDLKCIRCGQHAVNQGYFCETHRQVHNVLTREFQRRRFDLKHRDYDSESYRFSCSHGRLSYDAANIYLEAGRSNWSPGETSEHLRVALIIGFSAVEAYLKTVTDQFEVRARQTTPIDKRIEHLFKKFFNGASG